MLHELRRDPSARCAIHMAESKPEKSAKTKSFVLTADAKEVLLPELSPLWELDQTDACWQVASCLL